MLSCKPYGDSSNYLEYVIITKNNYLEATSKSISVESIGTFLYNYSPLFELFAIERIIPTINPSKAPVRGPYRNPIFTEPSKFPKIKPAVMPNPAP